MPFPSSYSPEMCEKAIELFSQGLSITAVSVNLGIHRDTYYEWKKHHPEFKLAAEYGEQKSEAYHEAKLHAGADGEIENFSAPARIFIMKNRFRQTYGEQEKEKSAGDSLLEQLVLGKVKLVNNE